MRHDLTVGVDLLAGLLVGFAIGIFAGFFGIGGGFLIVPGLMLATGMLLSSAIGTALVAATAASYAMSGLIDWSLAGLFVLGGLLGGLAGARLGKILAGRKGAFNLIFASLVIAVGLSSSHSISSR